ncbi:MAG: DUF1194 domain-containing protein [Rhodospirillales bacterium]|jgi:hypothetical protein
MTIDRRTILGGMAAGLALAARPAVADPAPVDVALVVAADVSNSIDSSDYMLQVGGMIGALLDDDLLGLIRAGRHGAVAIAAIEWSDEVVTAADWHRVHDRRSMDVLCERLFGHERTLYGQTDIALGLRAAIGLIARCPWRAERLVVDVSGDGLSKIPDFRVEGAVERGIEDLRIARALADRHGIVVNGLAIAGEEDEDIAGYYRDHVVTGGGSFVVPVAGFEDFGRGMLRKLMTELA